MIGEQWRDDDGELEITGSTVDREARFVLDEVTGCSAHYGLFKTLLSEPCR